MDTARAVRTVFTEAGAVLQNTENGATFTINPMGAIIWQHLTAGATKNEIVDRVSIEFGADRDQVYRDLEEFLTALELKALLNRDITTAR